MLSFACVCIEIDNDSHRKENNQVPTQMTLEQIEASELKATVKFCTTPLLSAMLSMLTLGIGYD